MGEYKMKAINTKERPEKIYYNAYLNNICQINNAII